MAATIRACDIARDDALGNSHARRRVRVAKRELDKIGKPVDRDEWDMTPPTVNAYYDPQMNNINFPAGILQPPFYDNSADDAVNFGGIGAVIGHELTHGFDDEGRQFDAKGNLRDWWTPEDAKEFEARAVHRERVLEVHRGRRACKVNGELTLGENTADNGGVRLALMALRECDRRKHAEQDRRLHAGAARVLLGFGQIWCENDAPEKRACRADLIRTRPPGTASTA